MRDLQTNTTTLVSRAGDAAAPRRRRLVRPSISADGRFVAFDVGRRQPERPSDNDGVCDVFVRDLQTGATTYVSRAGGAARGDGDSFSPSISADGRFVAFGSDATNLSADDDDASPDVFVRDLQASTTTLVSRAGGATGAPGDDDSGEPSISADGRFVAFSSPANNLSAEDDDDFENVFVRDVLGDPTPLLRRHRRPPEPGARHHGPALLASALTRANRTIRVSRRGRFTALLRALREPVTGTCAVRKVASRSFRAKAGRRVTARFRLSPSGFRTLKTNHKLRARATVLARDSLGNPTTVRFHVTLKAPKAHR